MWFKNIRTSRFCFRTIGVFIRIVQRYIYIENLNSLKVLFFFFFLKYLHEHL